MTSLVPCLACARHVRRQDARCPFCGAARTPSAGPFREIVLPRDATRATIFALGLSLAGQACDEPAPDCGKHPFANGCLVPPYGNMSFGLPDVGGDAGSTGLPDAAVPRGSEDAGTEQPGSSDAGSSDAGNSDAGPDDAGPEDAGG